MQRTQEDVIDALYTYTSSNYKDHSSKYGEILTLCSYITNVSIHFKTYLFHKLKELETQQLARASSGGESALASASSSHHTMSSGANNNSSNSNCGLLMELLKGDLLFQPNYQ